MSLCKTGTSCVEIKSRKSQARRYPYVGFVISLKLSSTEHLVLVLLSTLWWIPRDRICSSPSWRPKIAVDNQGHRVISSYSKRLKNLSWISVSELLFCKPCMGFQCSCSFVMARVSITSVGTAHFTFLFLSISQKKIAKNLLHSSLDEHVKEAALYICPNTSPKKCYSLVKESTMYCREWRQNSLFIYLGLSSSQFTLQKSGVKMLCSRKHLPKQIFGCQPWLCLLKN